MTIRRPITGCSLKWLLLLCLAATTIGNPTCFAQVAPSYAGRPFVLIAPRVVVDPVAGRIYRFGRAQLIGDSVVFAASDGTTVSGVFRGRGGPLTAVAAPGAVSPLGTLRFFHDGFARDNAAGEELVIAAGRSRPDTLLRTDGTNMTLLLAGGSLLPNSGNKPANVLGEPSWASGSLAVIAAHRPDGGLDDFRGVYRVKLGALEKVADIVTELPGMGVPDTFSSQVGFDGNLIAFWAAQGPSLAQEGMFAQSDGGPVRKVVGTGDTFPGGGTIDGIISPPFVEMNTVYFFAYDAAHVTRLIKFENGILTVLSKDGDLTAEGDSLSNLGAFGMAVDGGKVFFPALTVRGPGLYRLDGTGLQTVIAPGIRIGGILPAAFKLEDVAGDAVVVTVTDKAGATRLVANLNQPAVPVIVSAPSNLSVALGARLELKTTAVGEAPLVFAWQWESPTGGVVRATSDRLVLESVTAMDAGYYTVRVTNSVGSVMSESFFLNVEAPPTITTQPLSINLEAGDLLSLSAQVIGGQPIEYFWKKDGVAVTGDSQGQSFVRAVASAADSGRYSVTASNAWGQVVSAEAVVTVKPAAPNPIFNGSRFAALLTPTTPIPGTQAMFDLSFFGENSFRAIGGQLLFCGGPAGSPRAGVFAWENGTLTPQIGAGTILPNNLSEAEGFTLMESAAEQPLALLGYKSISGSPQPVGIYRMNGVKLEVIADTTMTVPGFGDSKFPPFFYGAVQAGGQIVFGTKIGKLSALFRSTATGLTKIVSSDQDLPVVGKGAIQFQSLAFDGATVFFVASTAGLQQQVALRVSLSGEITRVMANADVIPGTAETVRSFGSATAAGGSIYLSVFGPTFSRNVLEWRNGELRRIAGPGMAVDGGGTLLGIGSSFLCVAGGRVFLAGGLNWKARASTAVFSASANGIEPVFVANKLDARPVKNVFVAGAGGDRLIIGTIDNTGARSFYANVGPVDVGALTLLHRQVVPGTLRLSVPTGTVLEATGRLGEAWESIGGAGELDIKLEGSHRFFRLRQN